MITDRSFTAAAEVLRERGVPPQLDCAFVLGTGLGRIAEDITDLVSIPFAEIPGFPDGEVSGHTRAVCYGKLHGRRVLLFQGRAHFYETGNAAIMRLPIGLLTCFGSPPLILTNAAGALRQNLRPGGLTLITDHISFNAPNPLIGEQGDERFVSLIDAYDPHLRARLKKAASASGVNLDEGIYMWFSGPSFETPAEIRMAKMLGADLVGMSTVPEVILARRFGLRVAALSAVTNMAAGILGGAPQHQETRDVASAASMSLRRLFRSFLLEL